jgi:catabolite regulation protein CreA
MFSEETLKVFVYAVALAFKANHVNIMFDNKKNI